MSNTDTIPAAVDTDEETPERLPYTPDIKSRFRTMINDAIADIQAQAASQIELIRANTENKIAQMRQALADVERDVPDPVFRIGTAPASRDPYAEGKELAEDPDKVIKEFIKSHEEEAKREAREGRRR